MYCQSIKGVAYGKHDFTLHAGHDFNFTYQVPEGSDLNLTGYTGVCKIRKRPNEAVIFELMQQSKKRALHSHSLAMYQQKTATD